VGVGHDVEEERRPQMRRHQYNASPGPSGSPVIETTGAASLTTIAHTGDIRIGLIDGLAARCYRTGANHRAPAPPPEDHSA
jgi:hypothetical protein